MQYAEWNQKKKKEHTMIANIGGVLRARVMRELEVDQALSHQALSMRKQTNACDALAIAQSRVAETTHVLGALTSGRLAVVGAYLSKKSKRCFRDAGLFACFGSTPESRQLREEGREWVRLRRLLIANRRKLVTA